MINFETQFEKLFSKYVHNDNFRLPMSVKELRLFTERMCKEMVLGVGEVDGSSASWSQDQSTEKIEVSTVLNRDREQMKNTPIGLNSLSKTFNIIKIVGQGKSFHFICTLFSDKS